MDEGWVDKTCMYCKKNTEGAPRQVDSGGRFAHVACAENAPKGFFSKLFGKYLLPFHLLIFFLCPGAIFTVDSEFKV